MKHCTSTERRPVAHILPALGLFCALAPSAASQATASLPAVADTFIAKARPDTNFGEKLELQMLPDEAFAFVQFDLTSIPKNAVIEKVILQLSKVASASLQLEVREPVGLWKERTLTFANRPKFGSKLIDTHVSVRTGLESFSSAKLTDAAKRWLEDPSSNKGLRLAVRGTNSPLTVDSREASSKLAPKLLIRFAAVEILTKSLPSGIVGIPYKAEIRTRSQGTGSLNFEVTSLPRGLRAEPSADRVQIVGTPTEKGGDKVLVRVTDSRSKATAAIILPLSVLASTGKVLVEDSNPENAGGVFDSKTAKAFAAQAFKLTNDTSDRAQLRVLTALIAGTVDNPTELVSAAVFSDDDADGTLSQGDRNLATARVPADNAEIQFQVNEILDPRATRSFLLVITPVQGIPDGRTIATAILGENALDVRLLGSRTAAKVEMDAVLRGPTFVANRPAQFDGDANGDGRINALDVQKLAANRGVASQNLADPNGNGSVDEQDIELVIDRVFGRPVLLADRLDVAAGSLLTIPGFDLGSGESVAVELNGVAQQILIDLTEEKIIRIPAGTPAGLRRLKIRIGERETREIPVDIR